MEKKNIVFIATSLDGFIADKNGGLDWLEAIPNPAQEDMGYTELMTEVDAIVMGRKTFETVLGFGGNWPYHKPVFVLSHSLKEIPKELNGKVQLLSGDIPEVLKNIHAQGYLKLYIDGGTTIQNFLKEDLIDEMRLTTIPILLGGGFSLFGALLQSMQFELISAKVFLSQIVQCHYKRNNVSTVS